MDREQPEREATRVPAWADGVRCVNVAQAAGLLGIARGRMAHLLDTNQVRSWRMGRRRLIPVTELAKFIASQVETR